jgi:acetyltransferase-like isoleucine patch superfamily enzyme
MKKTILIIFLVLIAIMGMLLIVPSHFLCVFVIYSWIIFLAVFVCYAVIKLSGKWNAASRRINGLFFNKDCKNLLISDNVRITNKDRVHIGSNVSIGKNVDIFPLGGNYPSKVIIGNNVIIGDYNRFASCDCVEIGDDVLFAAYVHITDHSHEFKDISKPVVKQGVFSKGSVKIGKGSWLGYRSEVLSGVTIGEHCVIAAGAIVTKDIPSYSVAAGIPAKVIKRYDIEQEEWVNV